MKIEEEANAKKEKIKVVEINIEWRVWSWLRMNADRMLNTCKSMRRLPSGRGYHGGRVSNA